MRRRLETTIRDSYPAPAAGSPPRHFSRPASSHYQLRQSHNLPSPDPLASGTVQDPIQSHIDAAMGSGLNLVSHPSSLYHSVMAAAAGAAGQHMTGLLTLSGPETPPDAVLDQMALNDAASVAAGGAAGVGSAVQKVLSNMMKAEVAAAAGPDAVAALSAALQMQSPTCGADQKGFYADTVNQCRGT